MLEGLAAKILQTYIGKYVDVDANKLSVGLLSGIVELENLPVKPEAFNDNNLPFELKIGFLEKVKVNISLNALRYTPLVLTADNLFVIVGPRKRNGKRTETESVDDRKLQRLNDLENKWFKEVEFLGVSTSGTSAEEQTSYFSILGTLAYLLKNIHVNLNRIHIRYEDENSSIGIYIDSICIKNSEVDSNEGTDETAANETGDKAQAQNNKNHMQKSCEVNNFCIYTDTSTIYREDVTTKEKVCERMNFETLSQSSTLKHIVKPTSLIAQVYRDMSLQPLRKRNKPRIRVSSILKEFHLQIDEEQINYISNMLRLMYIHSNTNEVARPATSLSEKDSLPEDRKKLVRSWWFYAINCIQAKLKRPDRKFLLRWTKDTNSYRKIYEQILINRFNQTVFPLNSNTTPTSPTTSTITTVAIPGDTPKTEESINYKLRADLLEEQTRIESDWSFERLMTTRRAIFEKFVKNPIFKEYFVKLKQNNSSNSANQTANDSANSYRVYNYISWSMANLKGYYYGTTEPELSKSTESLAIADTDTTLKTGEQHTAIDEEVLALISDSIENDSLLRRDSLLAYLTFNLQSASIIIASQNTDIVELKFERSILLLECLPRHDSFLFTLKLGSFYLNDCTALMSDNNKQKTSLFPRIIYPKNSSQELTNFHVFELIYEHNPVQTTKTNAKHSGNLIVRSCGLDIIYNLEVFENIKRFFQTSSKAYASAHKALIRRTKKRTETEIKLNSSYHNSVIHKINFNFEITAPKVIFPQDFFSKNPLVVIFDFGRLALVNRNNNLNLTLSKSLIKQSSVNDSEASASLAFGLKKSKTDANFERMTTEPNLSGSSSGDSMNLLRRSSVDNSKFKLGAESEEEDEDDIFVTPSSTPTNEKMAKESEAALLNVSECNFENNLYSIYDLYLNDLQTVIGKYDRENLQTHLNRGQSNLHFLEKFDISIQVDIFKLKQNKLEENKWTPLKVNVKLSLLKLHIDDLKLTYVYKTLENLQKLFKSNDVKVDLDYDDTKQYKNSYPSEFLDDSNPSLFWTTKSQEFDSSLSSYINLDIDEIDMTMSISGKDKNNLNQVNRSLDLIMARKSICELRIFNVNTELLKSRDANQLVRLKIFGLLLIDARQIYGTDYQLLAASHRQIELDSKTGRITERSGFSFERQPSESKEESKEKLKPLISMDLIALDKSESNHKEYIVKSSFSMLDIVLNPETISELIMLFYSSYLNIKQSKESSAAEEKYESSCTSLDKLPAEEEKQSRVKINFEFIRLSVLLFRIESFEKAKKIALFELNGTSVQATILSEINYLKVISQVKGLKVSDLKQAVKVNANHKSIFGIGLQTETDSQVFEVIYKKSEQDGKHLEPGLGIASELKVQMASLCYLHSPEFIYELQCCFNDFSRFQAKVIKELTEKAASLFEKGKTYIYDSIADIYQQEENEKLSNTRRLSTNKTKKRPSPIRLEILLETPMIAIPMCADSNQLIIGHLGNITITNGTEMVISNDKRQQQASNGLQSMLTSSSRYSMIAKSMDHNLNQTADEPTSSSGSDSDLEKEIFNQTISDSTKFRVDLKSMNLFTVDLEKEKNKKTNLTTNLLSNDKYFIENNFQIYYRPMYSQKLIDETNVSMNLDYLPKFQSNRSSKIPTCHSNGDYLRVISKIKTCQITLSKVQLEQIMKTLDNIVYDDSKGLKATETTSMMNLSPQSSTTDTLDQIDPLDCEDEFFQYDPTPLDQVISTPKFNPSSFKAIYSKFSEKSEDNTKPPLNINVKFKIEKLTINLQADVERPCQDVAELCFNEYELSILKHEKYVKFFDMTLQSLSLLDKLQSSSGQQATDEKAKQEIHFNSARNFLLQSFTANRGVNLKHTCQNQRGKKKTTDYLSRSAPNINFVKKKSKRQRYDTYYHTSSKTAHNIFETELSTSLPPVAHSVMHRQPALQRDISRVSVDELSPDDESQNKSLVSPREQNPFYDDKLKRSDSMSQLADGRGGTNMFTDNSDVPDDIVDQVTKKRRDSGRRKKYKNCKACVLQSSPTVSIQLIFIDKNHPKIKSKFDGFNKFFKVKFSDLQLNVNPETWIIVLDMLGLGAKVWESSEDDSTNEHTLGPVSSHKRTPSTVKASQLVESLTERENHQSSSIDFEVKHFSIQLNRTPQAQQFAKFKVNNVFTFIESRYDFMKVTGKLGSLGIYDVSPSRGLYTERFLTSGRQALDFEFFKHNGPPDHHLRREFDNAFKLRMSSVKYIHTQRFISELTNYFQQFNQLQDTLSRMRALSLGQGVSYAPQRSSRVKLDIQTQTPIVVIPVHSGSSDVLVFNLGNIKIENSFQRAGKEGTFQYTKDNNDKIIPKIEPGTRACLLDLIKIQFSDTNLYSAVRFKRNPYEKTACANSDEDILKTECKSRVEFNSFIFKQHSANVLEKKSYLFLELEHNLETGLSHSSPDWVVHAKLNSFLFSIDLKQYIMVRGILDQNLGEKLNEDATSHPTFLMPNTKIETALAGEVWKCVSINLDLENVEIELLHSHEMSFSPNHGTRSRAAFDRKPLAHLAFLKSSLAYESFSDQSKLVDLVSTEILIVDISNTGSTAERSSPTYMSSSGGGAERKSEGNVFVNILCNPNEKETSPDAVKRLQLEIHFRSNKTSNRYSVLINNCRVITVLDWLIKVKDFLASNYERPDTNNTSTNTDISTKQHSMVVAQNDQTAASSTTLSTQEQNQQQSEAQPIEVKINLTNTDLVMVEKTSDFNSQAVILRITAFIEYNQRKYNRPFESCLQSIELFSCQMNAIEETALSIIDPVTFNIYLTAKSILNHLDENEINSTTAIRNNHNSDFILDISTEILKLRFSYLDFKLFLRLLESIKSQFKDTKNKPEEVEETDDSNESTRSNKFFAQSVKLSMGNFCICIIDDCKDVDIPLTDIQFNRIKLVHNFSTEIGRTRVIANTAEQGSAEFGLNIDYYNRLLSGWEPLIEPWLARLNWTFKQSTQSFTLTSMDVLNVNVTNPFIDLITGVLSNWKDEYDNELSGVGYITKRHKIFQPYRLVNLTGEPIEYCTFKDTNSSSVDFKKSSSGIKRQSDVNTRAELDSISSEWTWIEDKAERQFNFYYDQPKDNGRSGMNKASKSNSMHSNHHYAQRAHNSQLRELIQHRLRVKLDDWSEIRPLTIDKVGTYFRDINRLTEQLLLNSSFRTQQSNITRLIFDISLSGNATKLIEIKSPVSIKNRLNFKIQCRIEPCYQRKTNNLGPLIIEIDVGNEISVPIKYLPCNIWFRPLDLEMNKEAEFSTKFTNCNDINQSGQVEYHHLSCKMSSSSENFINPATKTMLGMTSETFYFFVKIKRHNFSQRATGKESKKSVQNLSNICGHLISIEPAFNLYNLLPIEFRYRFISTTRQGVEQQRKLPQGKTPQKKIDNLINGKIDSNKCNSFNNINCGNAIDLYLEIDNYRMAKVIEINPAKHLINVNSQQDSVSETQPQRNSNTHISSESGNSAESNTLQSNRKLTILRRVNFYDDKNRPLFLIARIIFKIGTGLNNIQNSSITGGTEAENKALFNPCPIEVHISAVYCFFNLTGLPLLFRQFNCDEAAGQSEEHEMARSNQPLLFSFNETDSPYACSMRIGKLCNDFRTYIYKPKSLEENKNIIPKWCKPFGLEGGSSYRALHVINNTVSSSKDTEDKTNYLHPDWVYYIGIEIKQGKGLLKDTIFVYFSTRYYLVNRSSQDLLISQFYSVQKLRDHNASVSWDTKSLEQSNAAAFRNKCANSNSIVLLSDSMTQFHWPRTDKDQLLSIGLKRDANFNWSGGFKIDNVDSFQLNLRNKMNSNELFLIKIEVILDGGTFFIVFSDTHDYPPPIKVLNMSEVPIYFYQSESTPEKYALNVKPNQTIKYSWDEPIMEKKLVFGVKGGTSDILDFSLLDDKKFLFYDNFIYIVFEKANAAGKETTNATTTNLASSEFVLASINNKVFIDYKESGNRNQLWYLTSDGFLVHEGSSPPKELMHTTGMSNQYVLDIEDVAPQPNRSMMLTLRKPDQRRFNTQKWQFNRQDNGLLCCRVFNMCLQIDGELKRMARVVLGPTKNIALNKDMIKVSSQSLRPGSGNLSLEMVTDGPTRVITIININEKNHSSITWKSASSSSSSSEAKAKRDDVGLLRTNRAAGGSSNKGRSLEVYVNLTGGIGISLIHWMKQEYEELLYGYLKSLEVNFEQNSLEQKLMLNVQSIQICNQLLNSPKQNLIYIHNMQNYSGADTSSPSSSASSSSRAITASANSVRKIQPALMIDFCRVFKHDKLITIKHLIVKLFDLNLQVEEKLLWKIIQMSRFDKTEATAPEIHSQRPRIRLNSSSKSNNSSKLLFNTSSILIDNENIDSDSISQNYYKTRINSLITNSNATKYSFNKLQIETINMTLSVQKTSRLSPDLLKIKSSLGIPLIQFENARISLKPFILMNEHDTFSCILNLIKKHYTQEFRSNAISILGSVDFLGNPLGFVVDFKESLSNVLSNGQVTDFVFAITHGFANSVSKFSGFLSEELNELTLDERHRETRDQIRNVYSNGSVDHFVGGALGFAVGIVGGALSVATQTYRGFSENGVAGAFSGFGKGAVGTVSKPIVGVLDLTNGIASAIRETSKTSYKMELPRIRDPRSCATPGALLTPFSRSDADAQKILYQVNNYALSEKYISIEQLNHPTESIICIITSQRILFIKSSEYEYTTLYEVTYQQLKETSVVEEKNKAYLEIFMETEDGQSTSHRFKFENKSIATSVANKIRFGKADFDETFYSLSNYKDDDD